MFCVCQAGTSTAELNLQPLGHILDEWETSDPDNQKTETTYVLLQYIFGSVHSGRWQETGTRQHFKLKDYSLVTVLLFKIYKVE